MLELQLINDDHEPSGVSLPDVEPEYTQEVVDRALRLVRTGNRVVTTCRVCGISEALYAEWCELHPEFAWAVLVAEAEAVAPRVKEHRNETNNTAVALAVIAAATFWYISS